MSPRKKSSTKSRRKKESKSTVIVEKKPSKKKTSKKKSQVSIENIVNKVFDDAYRILHLDFLGIEKEKAREIVKEVIEPLITSSVKPDALLKRVQRFKNNLLKKIIYYLLEEKKDFTAEQLEFIIFNGEVALLPYMSLLYSLVKKNKLDHLIPILRSVWEKYGRPSPFACPYCGFKSVTPLLQCLICGRSISEKELKEHNEFDMFLKIFAEASSIEELDEAISRRKVLWGEKGIVSHKHPISPGEYLLEISLTDEEVGFLVSVLKYRKST